MKTILLTLIVMAMADDAHAQIGWTLAQCRKHWGKEHACRYEGLYEFGSKIKKRVAFDQQGKVNDLSYFIGNDTDGVMDAPALLAKDKGVHWEIDTDMGYGVALPASSSSTHVLVQRFIDFQSAHLVT